MKVWVFAEAVDDKVTTATLELLTKAREIGSSVEAIYSGSGDTSAIAATVGAYGATKLHVIDPGDGLPGQVAAAGIAALAGTEHPDVVLFAQTYDGRDALATLGQARQAGAHQRHVALGRRRRARLRYRDLRRRDIGRREAHRRRSGADRDPAEVVRGRGVRWRCGRGRERRRSRRGARGRGEGARSPRRGAAGAEARRGGGRGVGRSWHRCGRELRAAGRGARQAAQGRVGSLAPSSTPAGFRTRCRSARRARRSSPRSTSRSASPARRSTSSA